MKKAFIGAASVLTVGLSGCHMIDGIAQDEKADGMAVCAYNGGSGDPLSAMGFSGKIIWMCADGTVRWKKPVNAPHQMPDALSVAGPIEATVRHFWRDK